MKTGYHSVFAETYFKGIDDAKKYGFDFVQFDLGVPAYFLNELSADKLMEIRKYAENNGVEVTFHSPGDNVSLFCDYPIIRQGILDEFKLMLEKANAIGARHMTFHTGIYPMFKKSNEKADDSNADYYENVLYDNIKSLIDNSGNVLICVENSGFNRTARKALQRLLSETHKLYLTLDIAKMYLSNHKINEDDFGFFEKNKDYIREIHVHDKSDQFGSHQIVGNGYVDFSLFKSFLNQNTYLNFEVRPVESAKQAKDNLQKILKNWNLKSQFSEPYSP